MVWRVVEPTFTTGLIKGLFMSDPDNNILPAVPSRRGGVTCFMLEFPVTLAKRRLRAPGRCGAGKPKGINNLVHKWPVSD